MTNSRQKGARGERMWRDKLREYGWEDARRGQQFAGGGDSPDVVGGPDDLHWEVKLVEALNVAAAMRQAVADAGEDKVPCVAHKKKRAEWLVTLRADDFLGLLQQREEWAKLAADAATYIEQGCNNGRMR